MKISTILDQIDNGAIALPEFQRGYVWNRKQVRDLMDSLYRKHPVGSLLVWLTKTEEADARGDGSLQPGTVKLLLDGQQRITSLYGIVRGDPPQFFDGNERAFSGLYFHLEDEIFEFYLPLKMKDNPLWINVSALMRIGVGDFIKRIVAIPEFQSDLEKYINRLTAIGTIKDVDLHVEEVTGEDKTVDTVVGIFNRVNSGGTKLSKGDLALAKICAQWPDARNEMKVRLKKWEAAGFYFKLDWFLRGINALLTGEAYFSAMEDVSTTDFQNGLQQAEKAIDTLLDLIASRLGLDHDRVLGSRYSFPILARYIISRGGMLTDHKERDKLLYWYIHTFLWGRYAGSTESFLSQDLNSIKESEGALDRLIERLRQQRGDLKLQSNDFMGWSRGARFYPLLYMMTRVGHAKDWATGIELSNFLLGKLSTLQVHHIFPKSLLYKHGYDRPDVNAIANFTFLTQETNLLVSDRDPVEYLEEFIEKQPGAVESHWIPMNRELWKVENYKEFLAARRELLAQAANDFLNSLLAGAVPEAEAIPSILDRDRTEKEVPGGVEDEEEERLIRECNDWVISQDLSGGEYMYELTDLESGDPLALVDLAWPNGLQEGLSKPVALLIDEGPETESAVNRAGYTYFTSVEALKQYIQTEILALEDAGNI